MNRFLIFSFITFLILTVGNAQEIKNLDKSPLDLAVFRPDGELSQPVVRILYSRPKKNKRAVFGDLVPYNKVWRTGANQSTEVNLYRDITIEGNALKAGNYTMYTIPGEKEWTIIFNTDQHTWGTYDYDSKRNILEFRVPIQKASNSREAFGIAFGGKDGKGILLLAWDTTEIYINFNY